LRESAGNMPGCLSYVVAKDAADENTIWVTEGWESVTSHDASLSLSAVKNAIPRGKAVVSIFERIAAIIAFVPIEANRLHPKNMARLVYDHCIPSRAACYMEMRRSDAVLRLHAARTGAGPARGAPGVGCQPLQLDPSVLPRPAEQILASLRAQNLAYSAKSLAKQGIF